LKTGSQQKWSCLDLGTGSGILALTAELLGAPKILGIDFDQRCIKVARANAKANQLLKTEWQHADLLQWKIPGKWNLIAANIYSSVLKATARKVVKALAIHGHLILSGILACEVEEIESLFINLGLQKKNRIIQGKWGALHFQNH
jgi:ribosomal protein L11 methyltransferase